MSEDGSEAAQLRRRMLAAGSLGTNREPQVKGRKFNDSMLLPMGCAATVVALSRGVWDFVRARGALSQRMMRLRVFAQAFTIAALVYHSMVANGGYLAAAYAKTAVEYEAEATNDKKAEEPRSIAMARPITR